MTRTATKFKCDFCNFEVASTVKPLGWMTLKLDSRTNGIGGAVFSMHACADCRGRVNYLDSHKIETFIKELYKK